MEPPPGFDPARDHRASFKQLHITRFRLLQHPPAWWHRLCCAVSRTLVKADGQANVMVQLMVKITAASGHASELVDALHVLAHRAELTRGCSSVHIAADVDEADVFWYCQDWQDREALERCLRSDQFSQLLALLETSAKTPSLEFRTVQERRGLDYIAAVREAGEP